MTLPNVLPKDDARLRLIASAVENVLDPVFQKQSQLLKDCLDEFRRQHGFGRGIAAPQIGISQRFIALNLGDGSFTLVNPEIIWHSEQSFTMWDDCMCFPDTLVKVRRFESISLRFIDESGKTIEWHQLDRSLSELLQHELDHLDGVLALDRAINGMTIPRSSFLLAPNKFTSMVDYCIAS